MHQNISFRTDGFTWSKVMTVLIESKPVEETLSVNVDSELAVRNQSRGWMHVVADTGT